MSSRAALFILGTADDTYIHRMAAFHHIVVLLLCFNSALNIARADTLDTVIVLKLNNTSPAALGSNITFGAFLYRSNGSLLDAQLYKYKWKDNIILSDDVVSYGDTSSNVTVRYNRFMLLPTTYSMQVDVYKKINTETLQWENNEKKIAIGKMNFTLTDYLNGDLAISQHLDVITPPRYYATKLNLTLNASISDVFSNASMHYIWHVGSGQDTLVTTTPNISLNITNASSLYFIGVTVVATLANGGIFDEDINRTIELRDFIELRDSIGSSLTYTGSQDFKQGSVLSANVTCSGSPPFNITWQLVGPSGHVIASSHSTRRREETCLLRLSSAGVTLLHAGNYTLHVLARNDVSAQGITLTINVPFPVASGIPVLCSIVGIVALLIIMYSYHRDRPAKPHATETANFHFHHYSAGAWTMVQKIKLFFQPRRWREANSAPTVVDHVDDRMFHRIERSTSYGSITSAII